MEREWVSVSDDELIRAIREDIEGPAFTAGELAEIVGMSVEGVRKRLDELYEEGEINRKKPGARTTIWYDESDYRASKLSE
ncbi:MAG: hypothetical protein ABEJ58_05865 [Halodesulfurarchaeum sp.]